MIRIESIIDVIVKYFHFMVVVDFDKLNESIVSGNSFLFVIISTLVIVHDYFRVRCCMRTIY